jgi:uncharacterized membrane protein
MNNTKQTLSGLVVGGFFVLLPVLLVGLLLERVFAVLQGVVHPLLDAMPGTVFHNTWLRFVVVLLAGLLVLLLTGLLARTRTGQSVGRRFESAVLQRLPFYSLLRNLASGLSGKEDERSLRPVLVTVNPGIQQLGLLIERHRDGSGTVFFPSSPTTGSGTVLVVEASLMRELRTPGHKLFSALGGWGLGTAALLAAAPPDQAGVQHHAG